MIFINESLLFDTWYAFKKSRDVSNIVTLFHIFRPGFSDLSVTSSVDNKGATFLDAFAAFRDEVHTIHTFINHTKASSTH